MSKQNIKEWLRTTKIPLTVISRELNISRNTLYQWMKPDSDIRSSNVEKFLEVYGEDINQKEETMPSASEQDNSKIDSNYVMRLQKKEIDRLELENQQLKQNQYTMQSAKWDEIQYDFFSDVRLTFIPFERTIHALEGHGVDELAEKLEINKHEMLNKYFQPKVWHKFNAHPVNALIEPNTLKELQGLSVKMPTIFDSLKLLVGEHYFQQLIVYKHKDKLVHSICNIKIHWLENPHRAECKTQFIKESCC